MIYENLLYSIGGIVVGVLLHSAYVKYRAVIHTVNTLMDKVDEISTTIDNPEEIAKKILTMKLPVNSLPPELAEQIMEEAQKLKTNKSVSDGMSYMG